MRGWRALRLPGIWIRCVGGLFEAFVCSLKQAAIANSINKINNLELHRGDANVARLLSTARTANRSITWKQMVKNKQEPNRTAG